MELNQIALISIHLSPNGTEQAEKTGEYTNIAKRFTTDFTGVPSYRAVKTFTINIKDPAKMDQAKQILSSMAAISISHANLCPFFCTNTRDGGLPAISTPWYEMGNLLDYVIAYPCADKGDLVRQTAKGLEHVHAMGIVHGNLNPSNVLISRDGKALIADIGLNATLRNMTEGEILPLPRSWIYKSPEELANIHISAPSMAADVYAFAGTVYTAYTSKPPISEEPRIAVWRIVMIGLAETVQQPYEIIDELWQVMQKCWRYRPHERLTTRQIVAELELYGEIDPRVGITRVSDGFRC